MNHLLDNSNGRFDDALRAASDRLPGPDLDRLHAAVSASARAEYGATARTTRPRRRRWIAVVPAAGLAASALFVAIALGPDGDGATRNPITLDRASAAEVLRDAADTVIAAPRFVASNGGWFTSDIRTVQTEKEKSYDIDVLFGPGRSWETIDGRRLDVQHATFTDEQASLGSRVGFTLSDPDGRHRTVEIAEGESTPLGYESQPSEGRIAGYPAEFVRTVPADADRVDAHLRTLFTDAYGPCIGITQCLGGEEADRYASGIAMSLVSQAPLDAPQRAALYRYLAEAAVGGARTAQDVTGRPGIALTIEEGEHVTELILDAKTGEALQTRYRFKGEWSGATLIRDQQWVERPMLEDAGACGGPESCDGLERFEQLAAAAEGKRLPAVHFHGQGVVSYQAPQSEVDRPPIPKLPAPE